MNGLEYSGHHHQEAELAVWPPHTNW